MALTKFKYVGGRDRGVNANKQQILYDIVFPLGKAVEVPDNLVSKMRTKDEFEEVVGDVPLTEFEKQKEADAKLLAKKKATPDKLTPEEVDELKAIKAREEARVSKIQEDAKLGR